MSQLEIALLVGIIINTIILTFFCLTLKSALDEVKPNNRMLHPLVLWALLIPVVSLLINFIVVYQLSESLEKEFKERNFEIDEKPGLLIGLGFSTALAVVNIPMPVYISGIVAIAGLIFFVQYWMKINWYKKVLQNDAIANPAEYEG